MRKALYFQNTSNHDLEYSLVQKTVARESAFKRFKMVEKAVKEKRREFDDSARLEMLSLLNLMRETTLEFLETVMQWQKMFVKAKRPTVMSEDYLIQMARSTEFVNASPLKKYYNFSVSRQNVFLLLMSTGKPKDPVSVTPRINEELQKLADPNLDRIIEAYKLFKQTFPKKKFSALLTLNQWMKTLWMPNVKIVKPPRPVSLPAMSTPSGSLTSGSIGTHHCLSPKKNSPHKIRSPVNRATAPQLRSNTASPTTAAKRHGGDDDGNRSLPKPLTASPIRKVSPSKLVAVVSSPAPQRETTSAKRKTKAKSKRKNMRPTVVPVTTGGSILDINNSKLEEPESTSHLSKDSGSYSSSILDKKSPKRVPVLLKPVVNQKDRNIDDGMALSPNRLDAGHSTASTLSSTKLSAYDGTQRRSPTRKAMRRTRPREGVELAEGSHGSSLSTVPAEAPPMSTMQLREWFQANGQQPTELVQVIPSFPTKRR